MSVRSLGFTAGTWAALAAVWLLLVDLTALPELITGAVCAAIATVGSLIANNDDVPNEGMIAIALKP